jgi:hypothetical protein
MLALPHGRQQPMRCAHFLQQARRLFIIGAATIALLFLVVSACGAQATRAGQDPGMQWAQELNKKYPGLLEEFARLIDRLLHNVGYPAARTESRLLPLLPESTTLYAAFPNYGDVSHQTLKIFQQELEGSAVLRDW